MARPNFTTLGDVEAYISLLEAKALDGNSPFDPNALMEAMGIVATTTDIRLGAITPHQATTQVVHGNAVFIPKGKTVTRIEVFVSTSGVGVTDAWVGIYDKGYNLLAVSADTPAFANAAPGWQGAALTTPWVSPRSDYYYLADLYIGGTQPFYTDTGSVANSAASQLSSAGAPFMWWQQTGQSVLPNLATPIASAVPHLMVAR